MEYNHLECHGNDYSPDNSQKRKEQFEMKISNKDGSKKAKELIMKVVHSVTYSVDSSARSKIQGDITKIFEIKKAANQRLAAISREDRIRTCDPLVPNQVRYRPALLPDPMGTCSRSIGREGRD